MSDAPDDGRKTARPASVEDLRTLLVALADEGVDYLLIGGYALYALGYQRGTTDIDLLLQPTVEQGGRVRRALLRLPEQVARELEPAWFVEGEPIRVAERSSSICCSTPAANRWSRCARMRSASTSTASKCARWTSRAC